MKKSWHGRNRLIVHSAPIHFLVLIPVISEWRVTTAEGTASTWNSSSLHPGIQERVADIVVGYSLALLQQS